VFDPFGFPHRRVGQTVQLELLVLFASMNLNFYRSHVAPTNATDVVAAYMSSTVRRGKDSF
jgi:hypothetical protein